MVHPVTRGQDGLMLEPGDHAPPRPPSVVCGVDNSQAALKAARVAAELADALGVRLVLAHVPTDPSPAAGVEDQYRQCELDAPAPTKSVPVLRLRTPWGEPATGLCRVAEAENAVLLVTGSRGRGALTAAFLGSVSRSLTSSAKVPVLVVPADARISLP